MRNRAGVSLAQVAPVAVAVDVAAAASTDAAELSPRKEPC